jgi:hypothetical protein
MDEIPLPLAIRTITISCDDLPDKVCSELFDKLETIDWEKVIRSTLGRVPGLKVSVEG